MNNSYPTILPEQCRVDKAFYIYIYIILISIIVLVGCSSDVPKYAFDEQYDSFAFNSLLTKEEAIEAVARVRTECNKVDSRMIRIHY